jgi:hypothetical protein
MAPYLMNHYLSGRFGAVKSDSNKLIFNNLHNPPPTKYFDMIINPLYSKQLLNLVLVEDCGGSISSNEIH